MKKFIFNFWTETSDKQKKNLTLRVVPSTWEDDGIPNGYLFLQQRSFNIFIDDYKVVEERSSPDWKEYFDVYVSGGLRLQVGGKNQYSINLNLPTIGAEWLNLKGVRLSFGTFFEF